MNTKDQTEQLPNDKQLTLADQIAHDFLRIHTSIHSIAVSSIDGRSLVHATNDQLAADQLAAMTSSTVSLCLALQRELDTGQYQQLALDGSQGRVIMLRLNNTPTQLTLTVVSRHRQALGHDLWIAHQLCSSLEFALSA